MSSEPPKLSVVVAASDSGGAVAQTVRSIAQGNAGDAVEIVVAYALGSMQPCDLANCAIWVQAEPGASVPRLRAVGLEATRGDWVAFTEDSCRVGPQWTEAWARVLGDSGALAASGPVGHSANASALDWAVFFCEYAPYIPPRRNARLRRLAGNNFAARRDILIAACGAGRLEEWAVFREAARRSRDGASEDCFPHTNRESKRVAVCMMDERTHVDHVRSFPLRQAIRDRLRYGWEFGSISGSSEAAGAGGAKLLAGPGILVAQLVRLGVELCTRQRYWGHLIDSLPITVGLLAAWSVAEWLGRCAAAVRSFVARSTRGRAVHTQARPLVQTAWRPAGCSTAPDFA
jgi:hypothetical protein